MKDYEAPKLEVIGSVQDLTQQSFDKIGSASDIFTQLSNLDGDIIPDP